MKETIEIEKASGAVTLMTMGHGTTVVDQGIPAVNPKDISLNYLG